MEAAREGLNEATLADDAAAEEAVVDCSTMARSSSVSSVSDHAEPSSVSCLSRDDDSSVENADDAEQSRCRSPGEITADVEATTTTTTSTTSVPLLEQLVSSPCELVNPVLATSAESTSSPLTGQADGQRNLSKSFLHKLESFVSSVGQAAATAPLTSWIRRPVFPSRPDTSAVGSGGTQVAARKPEPPPAVSMFSLQPSSFSSRPAADSSRPLDLSAKRMESSVSVDSTQTPQHGRTDLIQHCSGQNEVLRKYMDDVTEVQTNGASSLACLERDFGEHSTILTRLGSRDRQRRAVVSSMAKGGTAASRRGRTVVMPGLTPVAHNAAAGAPRLCAPLTATAPHTELRLPRSCIDNDRHLLTGGRTGVVGGKLEARQPAVSATTAATVLRCLQCNRTFFSLPELTLHMIQSAHYANLICAAAAYSYDDDEDCVVVDAYNSRQTSNVDHSTRRSGTLQTTRGKVVTEMVDAHRGDHLCRSNGDIRRRDCVDTAVSPARSLDDESVSSAGLTETESQRSPTSSGSPTSPPYENVGSSGASDDELAIMSHLLRLQPLLSRTVLDSTQTGPSVPPGYVDWTKVGLAAAEERRRQLVRGRASKTSMRQLEKSPAVESLPIDMRCQRTDGNRFRDSQPRQTVKAPALTPRTPSNAYLQKLLDDVRGYRSSLNAGFKRSASSKWCNGKQRPKKYRTCSISSSEYDQMLMYDGPRRNGDRSIVVPNAAAVPTSGEACLRKPDDSIHARLETVCSVRTSPSALNHEQHLSSQRQETADCMRRLTSNDATMQQPGIDSGTPNSPALPVGGRDSDKPNATGRDFRRPGVDKDHSEYAARFGKYYRLAQELSSKSE